MFNAAYRKPLRHRLVHVMALIVWKFLLFILFVLKSRKSIRINDSSFFQDTFFH